MQLGYVGDHRAIIMDELFPIELREYINLHDDVL